MSNPRIHFALFNQLNTQLNVNTDNLTNKYCPCNTFCACDYTKKYSPVFVKKILHRDNNSQNMKYAALSRRSVWRKPAVQEYVNLQFRNL